MKARKFQAVLMFLILLLWGCGMDEVQTKPDYTLAGKQMFDKAETHITMVTSWLDVMFKMNAYIEAPAANKIAMEDKYFSKFKIRNTAINTWSLIDRGDTLCKIISSGTPFTTAGAKWILKTSKEGSACTISCINDKKWLLNVSDVTLDKVFTNTNFVSNYSQSTTTTYTTDSLVFESDVAQPETFESVNFTVSGKGKFALTNQSQSVLINFLINQPLKHTSNSTLNINSGKYELSATDLKTLEQGKATAEFETLIGNYKNLNMVYNGRTHFYQNYNMPIQNAYVGF